MSIRARPYNRNIGKIVEDPKIHKQYTYLRGICKITHGSTALEVIMKIFAFIGYLFTVVLPLSDLYAVCKNRIIYTWLMSSIDRGEKLIYLGEELILDVQAIIKKANSYPLTSSDESYLKVRKNVKDQIALLNNAIETSKRKIKVFKEKIEKYKPEILTTQIQSQLESQLEELQNSGVRLQIALTHTWISLLIKTIIVRRKEAIVFGNNKDKDSKVQKELRIELVTLKKKYEDIN